MDVITYALSRKYTQDTVRGMGAIQGSPCTIASIVDNLDGTHNITFSWKDNTNVTHTSVLTVKDGETPAFSSVAITGGNRLTFTTQDPTQSVSFDVMDGAKGDTGVSVVSSNVDENNNLTLTLSNGNVINAGKIKAVTNVDNALSTTSANPVENKVITNALNNKVDKEMGKGLFSDTEKAKLANIEDGAQVNVLEKLIVNGQEATITDKSVALTLITSAVSNLQNYYLKTETYTKQEVEDLIGSTVGVTIEIVQILPTEGQANIIYFLPTETEGVYSQYIYTADGWILIGSTTVDLSNYYTKAQVDTLLNGKQNVLTIDSFPTALSNNPVASGGVYTAIAQMQPQFQFSNMPTPSSSNLGFVYQYTGATGAYTQNMFYRCVYDESLGEYKWVEVLFHATVTVDSALSGTSTNPVQNKVVKEALDTKQDLMQYSTMPSAQDNLGKIVEYIGSNTANYTNGYFYKSIYDSERDIYLWKAVKFSADMLVDNALSTTSENPVQNKVITGAINNIQDLIPNEASTTNQLVDRNSLGTASQKNFTPYVSPDNTGLPISSSVYSAITNAVYGAYHPSGSKSIAELTSDLLVLANIGNVYKITEDGVTTNLFVGGAGQTIHTGDNAVVVYGGQPNTFLFDLQSGSVDLTSYQTKALGSAIVGETTVEGALGGLNDHEEEDIEGVYKANGVLGAKNLIPFDLARIKSLNTAGTWTNNVYTPSADANVTFTVNSDGTVKITGNNTANVSLKLIADVKTFMQNQNYVISGCPSGGSINTYYLQFTANDGTSTHYYEDVGNEKEFTYYSPSDWNGINIGLKANAGADGKVFKPMLRLASDTDSTYVPYVPTNATLNEEKMSYADNNVLGAKNLLLNTAITQTINGVTFTVNDDGTITTSGTATDGIWLILNNNLKVDTNLAYLLNGCPSGGSEANTFSLYFHGGDVWKFDEGNGSGLINPTQNSAEIAIHIHNGVDMTGKVFKPMLRLVSDHDDTYVPYSMTNQQMTPYIQAVSNPNFLDNPWFTVNQRGINSTSTTWTQFHYGVDRWLNFSQTTQVLTANGVTELNGGIITLYQILDTVNDSNAIGLYGKVLTFSIMYSDGVIDQGTALLPLSCLRSATRQDVRFINTTDHTSFAQIENYDVKMNIVLEGKAGTTIRAVKLEIGSISTLAHDVAPNYTTELLKCQRYFERNSWYDWGCIYCKTAGQLNYGMTYPYLIEKRATPTFTFNVVGTVGLHNGYVMDNANGTVIPTAEIVLQQPTAYNSRMVQVRITHPSFTVGHSYAVAMGDHVIDISAELY